MAKLKEKQEFVKLGSGESVDMLYKREFGRRSYASLVTNLTDEDHTLNIAVGAFKNLQNVPVSVPGIFYYQLQSKEDSAAALKYGLVVDVAVTGSKKTITIRSPLQFYNHLITDVELWTVSPKRDSSMTSLAIIKPTEVFVVPIDVAHSDVEFYVTPAGFDFQPDSPLITWLQKTGTNYFEIRSKLKGDDSVCHFTRVDIREEKYKLRKNLPVGDFPHHIFHLRPPLVLQNLLPFTISVGSIESGCPMRNIEPGEHLHVHDLNLEAEPLLIVSVDIPEEEPLKGKLKLSSKPPEYSNFAVSASEVIVDLGVHTEDLGYLKMGIFSPFWMINKTGLTLEYKEGSTVTRHPSTKNLQLLSTTNPKCKIQLGTFTVHGSHTDWSKSFPINAIGSSGNVTAKLGENNYKFGVEVRLSHFTLTKLVLITPYFLLVNETEVYLQAWETNYSGVPTHLLPGEVVPFWPLSDTNKMIVTAGKGERTASFNYKSSDFSVLKFENELVALCVEVQESESATTVTFSPYYPGCAPVQIINNFPDLTLRFRQDTKSVQAITHTLGPYETLLYTWDDHTGKKLIKWDLLDVKVNNGKPINVNKDAQESFNIKIEAPKPPTTSVTGSLQTPPPRAGIGDTWLEIDESFSEQLVSIEEGEGEKIADDGSSDSLRSQRGSRGSVGGYRAYWKTFIDGLQRTLIFTPDEGVIDRIKAGSSYSVPQVEVSLSLRAIGLSLVDNHKKRELAYIAATQSGVIWQVDKGKGRWKTLNNSVIALLEDAHQNQSIDIKLKNLVVNLATMEMYSPVSGKLRRTHHDGLFVKFSMSETDYSIHAKIGHMQADNQLPFSVYPQVLYPLPPPPTVASTAEPKPFIEASVILRKTDEQSNVKHLKYVHLLVQKMAVNVDLGFILSLVDFFSLESGDANLETEYVKKDIEHVGKNLKETFIPELSDDFEIARTFFDVLHLAPIKITLSFNVRSVGKNKSSDEITVGDKFLELFLHSVGVILTSVQDTEMKFSCFHLEYQTLTGNSLTNLLIKHYRTQALFQLHTLIFGLDVLGNPISVVRGVVVGAVDLFYEPIKGSVLGPEEFFEGLGIGLRSFFGAGVVGGLTGAGARITGAFGDVFAKLTFDDEFIDKRQQEKARPPKLGSKLGGFAKNLFEGVTGVVTQPVKGLQKEGAVGLLKGTGRGLVGLLVRPTGGLVDLASGTLDFVTRKTSIGNIETTDIRPPRHIGKDGVVKPYSPHKAIGTALLVGVNEGKYVETDYYFGHVQISDKGQFVLVTDRRLMVVERKLLTEGWKAIGKAKFEYMAGAVEVKDTNVIINYLPKYKEKKLRLITVRTEGLAHEVADVINQSYRLYTSDCAGE